MWDIILDKGDGEAETQIAFSEKFLKAKLSSSILLRGDSFVISMTV